MGQVKLEALGKQTEDHTPPLHVFTMFRLSAPLSSLNLLKLYQMTVLTYRLGSSEERSTFR